MCDPLPHAPGPDPVTVTPLPDLTAFSGDPNRHRRWYRDNIATLIVRRDLNGTKIATAAGVSNRTISDWVLDETKVPLKQYRAAHGWVHTPTPRPAPTPRQLSATVRVHRQLTCHDGTLADIVVDLRDYDAVNRSPATDVITADPHPRARRWHSPVQAPDGWTGHSPTRWLLDGYGVGTNKTYTTSILTATDVTDPDRPWRLTILVPGRSHGRFAMSWCEETLPYLAAALTMRGHGTHPDTLRRHDDAQHFAHLSLDSLKRVLVDLPAWAGLPETTGGDIGLPTWDPIAPWTASAHNLATVLTWAGAGLGSAKTVRVFHTHGWNANTAESFWTVGVGTTDQFEELAAIAHAIREPMSPHRIRAILDEIHDAGWTPDEVIDWMHSPLARWLFNSPDHAARTRAHGWTRHALLRLGHHINTSPEPLNFAVEVLLWERLLNSKTLAPFNDLLTVSTFVEAGLTRTEAASMLAAFYTQARDAAQTTNTLPTGREAHTRWLEQLAAEFTHRLTLLTGLHTLTDAAQTAAATQVAPLVVGLVPRGYPRG